VKKDEALKIGIHGPFCPICWELCQHGKECPDCNGTKPLTKQEIWYMQSMFIQGGFATKDSPVGILRRMIKQYRIANNIGYESWE